MIHWLHRYLLNQVLLTNVLTVADDLPKYGCFCWICLSLPLCPSVPMGISSSLGCDIGNSTISNQLVAVSIIVMHIKLITVLSLPLRVHGPTRSTHNASQGVVMTSFAGSFPYWWFLHLFTYDNYGVFRHVIGYSTSRITTRRLGPRLHAAVC
jgi:hypothetical protein